VIGRVALGAAGVATMGYGITRLWFGHQVGDPVRVVEWLVGAIIIHDLGIAPLVIGTGYVLTRVLPGWARSIVQGGLLVAGAVLVISIPLLIKPVPSIPTVLPLDYARNLAIVLGSVAFGTAALIGLRGWRRHRAAHTSDTMDG
jgi:hypothetical protein